MNRVTRPLAALAAAAAVSLLALYWPHVRDEFFVLQGNRGESGGWYGWWSGFGGATQNFTLAGGALIVYRHKNCHVHRCWRLGRHPVDGTPYVTCRRHHPTISGPVTAQDIADAHLEAS